MRFTITISIGVLVAALWSGNFRARNWGGTQEVTLPRGRKLVTATWKGSDVWYLTREAKESETPERWRFSESSTYGIFNGEVVFVEVAFPPPTVSSPAKATIFHTLPATEAVHLDVDGHSIDAKVTDGVVHDIYLDGVPTLRETAPGRTAAARVLESFHATP